MPRRQVSTRYLMRGFAGINNRGQCCVRITIGVKLEQCSIVHVVDMICGKNQYVLRVWIQSLNIPKQGIRRAQILLAWTGHADRGSCRSCTGSRLLEPPLSDVLREVGSLVLGDDGRMFEVRSKAIRQSKINNPGSPNGTAGFERLCVRGASLAPRPPASTKVAV